MGRKSLIFVLCFFVRVKVFRKNNGLEITLIPSIYTTTVYSDLCKPLFTPTYDHLLESFFIYDHLLTSVRISATIYENLFENKAASVLILSYWTYRLSSKHDNDILLISYVPSLCFLFWILLLLCLIIFLLNKVSLNSLNSVAIFTPFAVLDSLPSIFFMEYIFHFNPTKISFIFPSFSSFILPITFSLVGSKNFESFG